MCDCAYNLSKRHAAVVVVVIALTVAQPLFSFLSRHFPLIHAKIYLHSMSMVVLFSVVAQNDEKIMHTTHSKSFGFQTTARQYKTQTHAHAKPERENENEKMRNLAHRLEL